MKVLCRKLNHKRGYCSICGRVAKGLDHTKCLADFHASDGNREAKRLAKGKATAAKYRKGWVPKEAL